MKQHKPKSKTPKSGKASGKSGKASGKAGKAVGNPGKFADALIAGLTERVDELTDRVDELTDQVERDNLVFLQPPDPQSAPQSGVRRGRPIATFQLQTESPWTPVRLNRQTPNQELVRQAITQAIGAASTCWSNPSGAGQYDAEKASWVAEGLIAWLADDRNFS